MIRHRLSGIRTHSDPFMVKFRLVITHFPLVHPLRSPSAANKIPQERFYPRLELCDMKDRIRSAAYITFSLPDSVLHVILS